MSGGDRSIRKLDRLANKYNSDYEEGKPRLQSNRVYINE